jgi:WD40 repeat protein
LSCGQRLFSGSRDKTVKEWGVAAGSLLRTMPFNDGVYDVVVNADGDRLVVGLADDTFLTLDTRSHALLEQLKLPCLVR